MIGKIYTAMFKFLNAKNQQMEFKYRPVLIIGRADYTDYVVLPISSVSISDNVDKYYDIEIHKDKYTLLKLAKDVSYIRTNKQTVLNFKEIEREISDLKTLYPDLFKDIMDKVAEFQQELQNSAFL